MPSAREGISPLLFATRCELFLKECKKIPVLDAKVRTTDKHETSTFGRRDNENVWIERCCSGDKQATARLRKCTMPNSRCGTGVATLLSS